MEKVPLTEDCQSIVHKQEIKVNTVIPKWKNKISSQDIHIFKTELYWLELKDEVTKVSTMSPLLISFIFKYQWLIICLGLFYILRMLAIITHSWLPIKVHLDWSSCLLAVWYNKTLKPPNHSCYTFLNFLESFSILFEIWMPQLDKFSKTTCRAFYYHSMLPSEEIQASYLLI